MGPLGAVVSTSLLRPIAQVPVGATPRHAEQRDEQKHQPDAPRGRRLRRLARLGRIGPLPVEGLADRLVEIQTRHRMAIPTRTRRAGRRRGRPGRRRRACRRLFRGERVAVERPEIGPGRRLGRARGRGRADNGLRLGFERSTQGVFELRARRHAWALAAAPRGRRRDLSRRRLGRRGTQRCRRRRRGRRGGGRWSRRGARRERNLGQRLLGLLRRDPAIEALATGAGQPEHKATAGLGRRAGRQTATAGVLVYELLDVREVGHREARPDYLTAAVPRPT